MVTLSARASWQTMVCRTRYQAAPALSGFKDKLPARCWADSMAIADDITCVKLPSRRAQILREQK